MKCSCSINPLTAVYATVRAPLILFCFNVHLLGLHQTWTVTHSHSHTHFQLNTLTAHLQNMSQLQTKHAGFWILPPGATGSSKHSSLYMYICTLFSSNSKHEAPLASRAVSTSRYSKHFFYRTQRLHPKQPEHLCLGNWLGKRFCFSSTTVCMQACVDLAHLMLRLFLNGLLLAAVHYLFMAPTHTLEHAAEKKPRKGRKKRGGGQYY